MHRFGDLIETETEFPGVLQSLFLFGDSIGGTAGDDLRWTIIQGEVQRRLDVLPRR